MAGVFGIKNALQVTFQMMHAMQYRGEQSAGVVLADKNNEIFYERELDRVTDLARKVGFESLQRERGDDFFAGIGHLRYGTSGDRQSRENAQPLAAHKENWSIYIAHNGDTPFYDQMKQGLLVSGTVFGTTSDTELILKFIGEAKSSDPFSAISQGLSRYRGTYALTMLLQVNGVAYLVAARDPSGNRPLVLGSMNGGYLVASEDTAFEAVGGETLREINPGEMVVVSKGGITSSKIPAGSINGVPPRLYACMFELIYFSFPNSTIFGIPVCEFREELGGIVANRLGHEVKLEHVITNVPDSSNSFADGFAKALEIPLERVIVRRHFGRSFTQDTTVKREYTTRTKHSFAKNKVKDRVVWCLDDSIVRGITSRRVVRALRSMGAKEVRMISASPPIIGPCKKGVDFDNDLIAAKYAVGGEPDIEKIRQDIEADRLYYATIEDLKEALRVLKRNRGAENDFCFGCFENKDPIWNAW
ncbi:MAG: amidophosphoribosyltransferase [Candidatus Liptonbacteria bacterium]|nr:amidophosphoribosyltransferase [Candidatus Liptonbacteria bacterium]